MLVAAVVSARTCGASGGEISADEAVELAREEASFEPCPEIRCTQRKFVQRGIPPRAYWGVVFAPALDPQGMPTRTESFLVDAMTGEVTAVS